MRGAVAPLLPPRRAEKQSTTKAPLDVLLPPLRRYAVASLLLLLGLALLATSAALAKQKKGGPKITVKSQQYSRNVYQPVSYFNFRGRPGEVLYGRITVRNTDRRQAKVVLDPVDSETAENLGYAYRVRGLRRIGATRWIRLATRRVTIAPRRSATIPLQVHVPRRGVKPGDYLSGISVLALNQIKEEKVGGGGGVIANEHRYAIGVLMRVPGPRRPLIRFTGARAVSQPAGLVFRLLAENPGNVLLKNVHGWVKVTRGNRPVTRLTIQPGTFVAHTAIKYPVPATQERPQAGTLYRVRAALYYRGRVARLDKLVRFGEKQSDILKTSPGHTERDKGFPKWIWLALALAAAAGASGYYWHKKHKARLLSTVAGLELLRRELAAIAEHGQPVSVAVLTGVPTDKKPRLLLVKALRTRLRDNDSLCEYGEQDLMVISKDTSNEGVTGLAAELRRLIARAEGLDGSVVTIGTATAERAMLPSELFAEV